MASSRTLLAMMTGEPL